MLSTFLSKVGFKSDVERDAKRVWNNGDMQVNDLTPMLGNPWPQEYYPYWRKWSNGVQGWQYNEDYASIDDASFWRGMAPKMNNDNFFQALEHASLRGNLSVLNAFSDFAPERMPEFAQRYRRYLQTARSSEPTAGLVHPDAVAWLRQRGLWNAQDALGLANAYRFGHVGASNIRKIDPRGACSDAYVLDWSLKSLRDHGWGADAQAQFLGNLCTTRCAEVWLDNRGAFEAVLSYDVDTSLLACAAGLMLAPTPTNDAVTCIYASVQQASQHIRRDEVKSLRPVLSIENGHVGLNMLIDLHGINGMTLMDLYRMAHEVKKRELGLISTESLALPDLGV